MNGEGRYAPVELMRVRFSQRERMADASAQENHFQNKQQTEAFAEKELSHDPMHHPWTS